MSSPVPVFTVNVAVSRIQSNNQMEMGATLALFRSPSTLLNQSEFEAQTHLSPDELKNPSSINFSPLQIMCSLATKPTRWLRVSLGSPMQHLIPSPSF
ncbi:hypothetical protein L1887_04326 [Cichorium endivia]|nr:hypothetical protein L1887_04326 [Cichorium endivia]